jgi:hypothetical protein
MWVFNSSRTAEEDTVTNRTVSGRSRTRPLCGERLQAEDTKGCRQTMTLAVRVDCLLNPMNFLRRLALLVLLPTACPLLAQKMLRVTPSSVQWGRFDAAAKPVLTVKPGEVVTIDTICGVPEMLERLGAATDEPIREMKQMYAEIKDRGPGPHFLTGPVAIEGAMPGDVLEVEILEIRLRSLYGWMMISPDAGALPEEFPYSREKLIHLDERNQMAEFGPGIQIPIHPFFGVLGVAPPEGRLSSGPPSYNAGNLDK